MNQRQRVHLATELLSATVASRFREMGWHDKADLIDVFNSWFDVFDSRRPYDKSKNAKCGYGIHLDIQNKHLDDMVAVVEKMTFKPRPGSNKKCREKKPFMTGINCLFIFLFEINMFNRAGYLNFLIKNCFFCLN